MPQSFGLIAQIYLENCVFTKYSHHKIRWNYGVLYSVSGKSQILTDFLPKNCSEILETSLKMYIVEFELMNTIEVRVQVEHYRTWNTSWNFSGEFFENSISYEQSRRLIHYKIFLNKTTSVRNFTCFLLPKN